MGYGWEGKRIRLAPVDPERHLEGCLRWMNDPEVTKHLALGAFPISRSAEKGWLERMAGGSETDVVFALELIESGRHIGMSGVHGISWVNRTATTGSLIGEADLRGQGLGSEQARIRARYCFEVLGLRILYSEFLEGNEASQRMQLAIGCEVWGVKPKAYFKNGRYLDGVQTVLTRERWESFSRGS